LMLRLSKPLLSLGLLTVVLLVVLIGPGVSWRQGEERMDPVTGSMQWETRWWLGISSGPRVVESPLEVRLRQAGMAWKRDWVFVHNTHRSVFGNAVKFECGGAPPIYELRPVLAEFVAASSDDELRQFVAVMQSGTPAQQQTA